MNSKNIRIIPINETSDWTINTDGEFVKRVSDSMLNENFTKESLDAIIQNGVNVLSQCPCPSNQFCDPKTGIVIGRVQSGKTSNFISLIALAFDNNYNLAIVYAGSKNKLLDQNSERIKSAFKSLGNGKLIIINTKEDRPSLTPERILQFIENGKKVIIISLKNQVHIGKISQLFNKQKLRDVPTIIIDDEGDQASLNTKTYKKELSTIYNSVTNTNLKSRNCFLSITATPQANILIDTTDVLSPDFGVLINPGKGYCGLNEFHGIDQEKYVKVIDEDGEYWNSNTVPEAVIRAISAFFVSNAIRKHRGDNGEHALLFHTSEKKQEHEITKNILEKFIDSWKQFADLKNQGDYSYGMYLKPHLINAYDSYKSDGVIVPEFHDLEEKIIDSIKECSPVLLSNSDNDDSSQAKFYNTSIFIGGNMIERGVTISGLAITYITRRARTSKSNIDNTEQRARWFGYKSKYFDICRVFTTERIKEDFRNINEHEDSLWNTIERAEKDGVRFSEIKRVFVNNSLFLQMTRPNVARTKRLFSNFDGFKTLEKSTSNINEIEENLKLFRNLVEINKENSRLVTYSKYQKHLLIPDLPFEYVKQEIFDKYKYQKNLNLDDNVDFDSGFLKKMSETFQTLEINPQCDVVWVRYEKEKEYRREIDDEGNILSGLLQGRDPGDKIKSNNFYKGDRSLPEINRDRMQIQLHVVIPKNGKLKDYEIPYLAIYTPFWITDKWKAFVTKDPVRK
ncbi:Z1 domain-containing protein [Mycoplasmopsis agassizii]|uniref:Putative endonuclease Z1 domain-containing protein n=1 Tax=Mycoplasmopsis agassizii TaxID=33922 RepID=A0ABX4H5C9_9BACT|nr:Z1 domain-containing protein [Mycoplasmopsis agassizii]PAF55082.1 hypothetical protein CJF60_00115 [Mycoplasmopsis agassizii]SMC19131.1 Z1 domain-containing protein [Mycoplasmopsis agassizii]